jgi:hypothetical protein
MRICTTTYENQNENFISHNSTSTKRFITLFKELTLLINLITKKEIDRIFFFPNLLNPCFSLYSVEILSPSNPIKMNIREEFLPRKGRGKILGHEIVCCSLFSDAITKGEKED